MSVVRSRDMMRMGIKDKRDKKKCRSYARSFCKVNKKFAINNFSFHLGSNNKFYMQSIEL